MVKEPEPNWWLLCRGNWTKLWPVSSKHIEKDIFPAIPAGLNVQERTTGGVWVRWKRELEVFSWNICTRSSKTFAEMFAAPIRIDKPYSAMDGYQIDHCTRDRNIFISFFLNAGEGRGKTSNAMATSFHGSLHGIGRWMGGERDHWRRHLHQGLLSKYGWGCLFFHRHWLSDRLQPHPLHATETTATLTHLSYVPTQQNKHNISFLILQFNQWKNVRKIQVDEWLN